MNMDNNAHNENQKQEMVEIQLRRIFNSILNSLWRIVIAVALCGTIAFVVSYFFIDPVYRATIKINISNRTDGGSNAESMSSTELATSRNLVNNYIEIMKTSDFINHVIDSADLDLTTSQVSKSLSLE